MKLRLTPLNIVSSLLLVSIAYQLFFPDEIGFNELGSIPLIILLFLSFVTDQIFRRLIPQLKRIWLIELLFLIFVAVLMILIKLYVFSWHPMAIGLTVENWQLRIESAELRIWGFEPLKQWTIKPQKDNRKLTKN